MIINIKPVPIGKSGFSGMGISGYSGYSGDGVSLYGTILFYSYTGTTAETLVEDFNVLVSGLWNIGVIGQQLP